MSLRAQLLSAAQENLPHLPDEDLLALALRRTTKKPLGRPPGVLNKPSTRAPKPSADPNEVLHAILEALKDKSAGLGSEHLQVSTKYAKPDITKAIAVGMEQGLIRKEGDRRATRYFSNVISRAMPEEEAPKSKVSKQMEIIPPPPKGSAPTTVIRRKKAGKG